MHQRECLIADGGAGDICSSREESPTMLHSSPLHADASYTSLTSQSGNKSHRVRSTRVPAMTTAAVAFCLVATSYVSSCSGMVLSTQPRTNAQHLLDTARMLRQQRQSGNNGNKNDNVEFSARQYLEEIVGNSEDLYADIFFTSRPRSLLSKGNVLSPGRDGYPSRSWTDALFDDNDADLDSDDEEELIASRVRAEADALSKLRSGTGSEIPEMELYLQMEAARKRASRVEAARAKQRKVIAKQAFIDSHVLDATSIEKVAMSAIPLQLPEPASSVVASASALRANGRSNKKAKIKRTTKVAAVAVDATSEATPPTGSTLKKKTKKENSINDESAVQSRATSSNISTLLKVKKLLSETAQNDSTAKPTKKQPRRKIRPATTTNTDIKKNGLQKAPSRVTPEEEIELARVIQRGVQLHSIKTDFETKHGRDITRQEWTELAGLDSPKELRRLVSIYRKAKNKLVTANMGLVYAIVKSNGSYQRARGISEEEMVQEGSLGLIRAAELFDPSRGLRFSTYATIWIKGVLSNSNLDQTISLPLREKSKWNKIRKAEEDLIAEHDNGESDATGYKPSAEDIARVTGLSPEDVAATRRKMTATRNVLSLDYQYESRSRGGGVESDAFEALQNDKAFMADADLAERLQLRADVLAALVRNLDPREGRLMRLRYGLKDGRMRTIEECAEAMGISRARCHQLAAGCLKKLREADDAESLQEYLLTVA